MMPEINFQSGISGSSPAIKAGQSAAVSKKAPENQVNNIQENIPENEPANSTNNKKNKINDLSEEQETDNLNTKKTSDPAVNYGNLSESLKNIDESYDQKQNIKVTKSENPEKSALEEYQNKKRSSEIGKNLDAIA